MIIRQIIFIFFLFTALRALCITEVNIGFFGDTKSEEYLGVQLGLHEAEHQGNFLDIKYNLFLNSVGDIISETNYLDVIITDFKLLKLHMLLQKFDTIPVLNLSEQADSLRQKCFINGFHIIPSKTMLDNAKILATQEGVIEAWHHNFKKYAALQLNNRFFDHYKKPMSQKAWFGWVSVKIIAEVSLRTRNPGELIISLKDDLKFDGQKGRKLSFRNNGQLRQPIFVIQNDRVIEEIPKHVNEQHGGLDLIGGTECLKVN